MLLKPSRSSLYLQPRLPLRRPSHSPLPIFDQRVADIVRERSVAYYPPRSKQIPLNPPQSDFEWFASAGTDLSQFRGMHIAVYQKKVIGWGATRIEAYQMAK